jgi:putative membrane protein
VTHDATVTHAPDEAAPVPRHRHRARRRWPPLAAVLAGATVLVQMSFPFTGGAPLGLTAAAVVLLAATSLVHAATTRGPLAAAVLLVVAGGGGLVAESVGVHTGFPFGDYAYAGTLGPEILGVPVLVPLAWTMMAWPAALVARRLVGPRGRTLRVLVGAWALTAWDVFLDPQMVGEGHWTWADPHPALPGVEGIPLTNFAGWLLVSAVVCWGLDRVTVAPTGDGQHDGPRDGVPVAVYLWTYGSSVLAHAAFWGRPSVALTGSLVMGLVAWPLAVRLWRSR